MLFFSCHSFPPLSFCPFSFLLLIAFQHMSLSRGTKVATMWELFGLRCYFIFLLCFLFFTSDTLARLQSFSLIFLSASLLNCMLSSVLLWLPRKKKTREGTNWIAPCFYSALISIQNLRHLVFKTRIKYLLILANSFPSLFIDSPVSISPPHPIWIIQAE